MFTVGCLGLVFKVRYANRDIFGCVSDIGSILSYLILTVLERTTQKAFVKLRLEFRVCMQNLSKYEIQINAFPEVRQNILIFIATKTWCRH